MPFYSEAAIYFYSTNQFRNIEAGTISYNKHVREKNFVTIQIIPSRIGLKRLRFQLTF
ncbi:hypothetical protein D3C75_1195220 [compost metagenome]